MKKDNTYAYPLVGRWQPSDDPVVIDEHGYQDIQNMRRSGKAIKSIKGHTKINTSAWDATNVNPLSIFHYKKDYVSESHIIVQGYSGSGSTSTLYDNTGSVPAQSNFSAMSPTPTITDGIGRYALMPQGFLFRGSGDGDILVYGGDESPALVITSTEIGVSERDVTEFLTKIETSDTVTVNSAARDTLLIGSPYRLSGLKIYMSSVNSTTSSLAVSSWQSAAWAAVSSLSDGTASGGVSLAQTGSITWDEDTADEVSLLSGYSLYWYKVTLSAGSGAVYGVTTKVPWQPITNIWDGAEVTVTSFKAYAPSNSTYGDYTWPVLVNSTANTVDLASMPTTGRFYMGFPMPIQGVFIGIKENKGNSNAATPTISYNDGESFLTVTNLDGVITRTNPLDQSGISFWEAIASGSEYPVSLSDEAPLYYYEAKFSADLDAEVLLYYVSGIPSPKPIGKYSFPVQYANRAFLFDEYSGDRNAAIYSADNAPYIFNGDDSGKLYFGDGTRVVSAASIYNVYNSTGIEQLIVCKESSTYRLLGGSPSTFEVQQMSGTVGCVAAASMAVCDVSAISEGQERHVAIWQSASGFVMCDGAKIKDISDDIRCYFDPSDSRCIPTSRLKHTDGSYDPGLKVYRVLISSGSGQTTHNVELEYSLKYNEWTKIYRGANPLQALATVKDIDGASYQYGATSEGFVYRLENGSSFDGASIESYLETKDMILDQEAPFFSDTVINFVRVMFKDQPSGAATITHKGDDVQTVDGTDDQQLPEDIDLTDGPVYTSDCSLGRAIRHSIKISTDDGMELTGLGVVFDVFDSIRQ